MELIYIGTLNRIKAGMGFCWNTIYSFNYNGMRQDCIQVITAVINYCICIEMKKILLIIILIPLVSFIEQPWQNIPRTDSVISVIYLGIVPTGDAWLLRFRILKNNGLIFQSQVSYLIPIFGTILSYIFLKELITFKVLISLTAVCIGIYFVKKADNKKSI